MCRRNKMFGLAFVALGVGIILGRIIHSGFFCMVLAIVLIALGGGISRQK